MNCKKNRILMIYLLFFIAFFSCLMLVNADTCPTNPTYKELKNVNPATFYTDFKNHTGLPSYVDDIQDSNYATLCFYKITDVQTYDPTQAGYALIKYNPSNETFLFRWGFFGSSNTTIDKKFVGECDVTSSGLDNAVCTTSPNGDDDTDKASYVRFEASSDDNQQRLIDNLKKGVCPTYVDYTAENFCDSHGQKRICFSNEEDACADNLSHAWDDGLGSNKSWERSYYNACTYGNSPTFHNPMSCVLRVINDQTSNLVNYDYNNNICNKDTVSSETENIFTNLDAGARNYLNLESLNIVKKVSEGVYEPGAAIYNSYKNVDNFISAFDGWKAKVDNYCVSQGITSPGELSDAADAAASSSINMLFGDKSDFLGSTIQDCSDIANTEFFKQLQKFFTIIKIAVPILVVVLISKDMLSAVTAGKEEDMKKAQKNAVMRLIIGIAVFFLPTLINILVYFVDEMSGTCGIN